MVSVNQTRPHCVNQMGKTHSKPLAARHGRGTAWARHRHGMLCVNRPLQATGLLSRMSILVTSLQNKLKSLISFKQWSISLRAWHVTKRRLTFIFYWPSNRLVFLIIGYKPSLLLSHLRPCLKEVLCLLFE